MNTFEDVFENSSDFLESLAVKYPGSRTDLLRLVARVEMDTRNAISRVFSDIELKVKRELNRSPTETDASDNVR